MTHFGDLADRTAVSAFDLRGGGLTARVLTYGATLQDLRLDGHAPSLVLGFPDLQSYVAQGTYFGATVGRCANRVRDGHFEIDGKAFQLDRNFLGKHMLHGGRDGIGVRNWTLVDHTESSVRLSILCMDGEMGFPGTLEITQTISLRDDGIFEIIYEATTNAPTLCNPAHHSYFNLTGEDSIRDHLFQLHADAYLPVDTELIPNGETRLVSGTGFDFREPRRLADGAALDHNFCLSDQRRELQTVGRLIGLKSGVTMEIATTEPGVQVYDGAKIAVSCPSHNSATLSSHAGIALEPQAWPDGHHHDGFPDALLRAGETYRQHTQYIFSKEKP